MRKNPISKLEVEKVEYIIEDIERGKLILNHTLQRYSGQWSAEQKGNLIRRILHDGQFLPILICTQYDENGCEVKYLIDGVQRISTIDEYIKDKFAISKKTIDYMVSYDGIVYDTKELKNGKFCLRRDKNKKLIPVLDEDGKKQRRVQEIDIRGLLYSELPPELQEKIKRYLVSVQMKLECTDEDIQLEILDYNSGTKMNDAQIGKNRLGVELAKHVVELSNHPFIINKCGFTEKTRIKGVVDRAINETLMLVEFGVENWVDSHKELCKKLANWLTVEDIDDVRTIFDDLDDIIPEDEDIAEYLTLKEFFVVMANYNYFTTTGYKKECYGDFLSKFVKKLSYIENIPTGDVDDDGEEKYKSFRDYYMSGGKQKPMIESRLARMNTMLDEYLAENCAGMVNEDFDADRGDTVLPENDYNISGDFDEELEVFSQNFVDDTVAIQSLMLSTDGHPYNNFEKDSLKQMVEWFKNKGDKQMFDDCLFYKSFVIGNGVEESDRNLPLYIYAIKYICSNDIDIDIDKWLSLFMPVAFKQIDNDTNNVFELNSTIAQKQSEIIQSITNF